MNHRLESQFAKRSLQRASENLQNVSNYIMLAVDDDMNNKFKIPAVFVSLRRESCPSDTQAIRQLICSNSFKKIDLNLLLRRKSVIFFDPCAARVLSIFLNRNFLIFFVLKINKEIFYKLKCDHHVGVSSHEKLL